MNIAMIGAGNVGRALAKSFTAAGYEVQFGVRNPDDPKHGDLAPHRVSTSIEAIAACDLVILALPWTSIEGALATLGDCAGKIVIDCTNPLIWDGKALVLDRGFSTSGGEFVAQRLPAARIVKTLNQVGSDVMADISGFAHPPVMFMASDDDEAKQVVGRVLTDIGFEPHDAGDLTKARLLEPFAMVWINQALARGKGPHWAFAALPRHNGE
jgi:8-hydroxy-5-deazaflavin:NADPH oxidoreductase